MVIEIEFQESVVHEEPWGKKMRDGDRLTNAQTDEVHKYFKRKHWRIYLLAAVRRFFGGLR